MLNTHDAEMRVVVSGGKNGAISRGRSDVIALGARVRRVDKGLAAKDYTIGIHKISPTGLRCVLAGTQWLQKYSL
jgi:hypothetical protein